MEQASAEAVEDVRTKDRHSHSQYDPPSLESCSENQTPAGQAPPAPVEPVNDKAQDRRPEGADDDDRHDRKRFKSPTASITANNQERSPSPTKRSKGRPAPARDGDSSEFPSRARGRGRLWTENDPPPLTRAAAGPQTTTQLASRPPRRLPTSHRSRDQAAGEDEDPFVNTMIKQPDTRPISQEQLVAEVKGIYAGLVMVESKCIEVDSAQNSQSEPAAALNHEQWQALIALHRTLLHEHHDFFLASQHPSASPALQRLAAKYAMPARMWRHGIHGFLELLRHRLPASLEHMLTFIYLAYSMMALLYETVPAFEDTWVECLGDLGRYRMAIEDEDIRDREIWTAVSRLWYSKASDKAPTTGRLHHHLAILARPNAVQQLFYYTKSLCVAMPFKSARESILTLLDPILNGMPSRQQLIDLAFVKAHGILFLSTNTDEQVKPKLPKALAKLMSEDAEFMSVYAKATTDFLSLLDVQIARTSRSWMEPGAFIAITNSNSLLEYGKMDANEQGPGNVIMSALSPQPTPNDVHMEGSASEARPAPSSIFTSASQLVKDCDSIVFKRIGDANILPYLHVRLAFMRFMAGKPLAMSYLEKEFPWALLCQVLNSFANGFEHWDRIEKEDFPRPSEGRPNEIPLPEDWSLRGLLWCDDAFFPSGWFREEIEDSERSFELSSNTNTEIRRERVLWMGWNLAFHSRWICYSDKQFMVKPEFQRELGVPVEGVPRAEGDAELEKMVTLDSTTTAFSSEASISKGSEADDDSSMVVERSQNG